MKTIFKPIILLSGVLLLAGCVEESYYVDDYYSTGYVASYPTPTYYPSNGGYSSGGARPSYPRPSVRPAPSYPAPYNGGYSNGGARPSMPPAPNSGYSSGGARPTMPPSFPRPSMPVPPAPKGNSGYASGPVHMAPVPKPEPVPADNSYAAKRPAPSKKVILKPLVPTVPGQVS